MTAAGQGSTDFWCWLNSIPLLSTPDDPHLYAQIDMIKNTPKIQSVEPLA
jgi:hypothetical protein